ncbi:MAG: RluA family pseudouridine synthase [Candidatus Colwellbacteria bacterium]|nr:RluA family pseudouridine synthase [Candidatus Colwellbacteria bacterium]
MEPKVIYEDENILAINKPAGLIAHEVRGKHFRDGTQIKEETLVDWLIQKYPSIKNIGDKNLQDEVPRPGLVHRLDRETSGVMLIAKNQKTFEYLKELFQAQKIKKTYITLVHGKVKENGVIDKPIGIKGGTVRRTVHVSRGAKMVREAITEYKVQKSFGDRYTLVKCYPKTGRTHQIRVHLASIGHPVVGDKLYGGKKDSLGLGRHFLHADSLELPLASGKRVTISADMPEDLSNIIDRLASE